MRREWRVASACPDAWRAALKDNSALVSQLLWNRGLREPQAVGSFLHPDWDACVHDPGLFRRMDAAVDRIFGALDARERITVHGDYDADGVTGSAVLISTLRELERHLHPNEDSCVDFYLPHRDKEGYGLHPATIDILAARGTRLIITVDCGIACVDEIALAKSRGMHTVVVDHHQFGARLPDGDLIHPGLNDETYPHKTLAAVGVAFKLACALIREARRRGVPIPAGWEKWLLDLVAIATVTDMVPLQGENRVLEHYGLRVLNKTRRPGLRALIEAAGLQPGALDADAVGFALGPRLNAAGRMDHAGLALNLLLAASDEEAQPLAAQLEGCNRQRQQATRNMLEQADGQLDERHASTNTIVVLWDERWSPALVGLVAGKLVERTCLPVVAIGQHAGTWIGSGRSRAGYDITKAMREAGEGILARVGGHPQACGFALSSPVGLEALSARLQAHAATHLQAADLVPTLELDAELPVSQASLSLLEELNQLAPFGQANPRPSFAARGALVQRCDRLGAYGQHLRLQLVSDRGSPVKAMAFNYPDRELMLAHGERVDLAYHLEANAWNGKREIQLKVLDMVRSS